MPSHNALADVQNVLNLMGIHFKATDLEKAFEVGVQSERRRILEVLAKNKAQLGTHGGEAQGSAMFSVISAIIHEDLLK